MCLYIFRVISFSKNNTKSNLIIVTQLSDKFITRTILLTNFVYDKGSNKQKYEEKGTIGSVSIYSPNYEISL